MKIRIVCILICLSVSGCKHPSLEKGFFDKPLGDRNERIRYYSLEDQYKIFRYGNDRIEPPFLELAEPIAEKGPAAVPFLLEKLNTNADDITVRDILFIFERMAQSKSYDVKSDATLMDVLTIKINGMKDKEWKAITLRMLQRIKDS